MWSARGTNWLAGSVVLAVALMTPSGLALGQEPLEQSGEAQRPDLQAPAADEASRERPDERLCI